MPHCLYFMFCPLTIVSGLILFLEGLKLKLVFQIEKGLFFFFFKLPREAFPP